MPDWVIEHGIGETRCVLVQKDEILEARIRPDGAVPAGTILAGRLTQAAKPTIAAANGVEYLLPKGAPGVPEGAALAIEVTREAIPGSEPWKRPLAMVTNEAEHDAPPLEGRAAIGDELGQAGWDDVLEEARSGIVRFAGGELRIQPTAAMTVIDVDGYLGPEELAALGAAEVAKAVRRLDIGGSIGIDLPTSGNKAARQAAAAAIDEHLPQPFERTAVNGFGFVQIVRPRKRASLIELAQDRSAFEARALLRRVALEPAGSKRLVVHPAVAAALEAKPVWLDALAGAVGGPVGLRADAALPMSGGYAEKP